MQAYLPAITRIGLISLIGLISNSDAQVPTAVFNAQRAKILDGVETVPKIGAPGPVGLWGPFAFPILAAADKDGVEIAVGAAAAHGKGRLILFGHNSYLSGDGGGDHARLLENCVKWAANKDQPRVGLKGVKVGVFSQSGFKAEDFATVDQKDWLIGHGNISEEARRDHIRKIKSAKDKWQTWKSDPFLALTTYIQLVQAFGWESWRAYLHSFGDPAFGPDPKNDEEARDQFLRRYSKIVNKNLGPFFDFWGIPVSVAAKEAVAGLEAWMPK